MTEQLPQLSVKFARHAAMTSKLPLTAVTLKRWLAEALPSDREHYEKLEHIVNSTGPTRFGKTGLDDVAIAALARRPIELPRVIARPFGLRDSSQADSARQDFDWNFDIALSRFVTLRRSQHHPEGALDEIVARQFVRDGRIDLLISTVETDREKIGFKGNVGDNFGLHVTKFLCGKLELTPSGVWLEKETSALMTVGSFIQHAKGPKLVWGTGTIEPLTWIERPATTQSIFFGVRGPRTREQLLMKFELNVPVVGDPGILIADMLSDCVEEPVADVGFVVHGVDRAFVAENWPKARFVDNRTTPHNLVREMSRCR